MTAPQYKNIIQWTLREIQETETKDSLTVARRIFKNLGVSFPNGDLENILKILKSKEYMGWKPHDIKYAQRFADVGVAAIGIDLTKVIIILPDEKTNNLSYDSSLNKIKTDSVKHTSELSPKETEKMHFFAYSYGYLFEDE